MDVEGLHELLDHGIREWSVPGAQIGLRRGTEREVICAGVIGIDDATPVTPSTTFHAGSITKSLVGLVVLDAARRGQVDLDVSCCYPGRGGPVVGDATVDPHPDDGATQPAAGCRGDAGGVGESRLVVHRPCDSEHVFDYDGGMDSRPMTLAERRSRFEAAREALTDVRAVLHQASGPELAELMTLTDGIAAQAAAARVEITVEAVTRGEVADSGCNTHAWVRDHAPSLRQGGAGDVAKLADAVTPAVSQWRPEGGDLDPESPLGIVWAAVAQGSISPALATATLREFERLAPSLREEVKLTVLGALLDLGRTWGQG